MRGNDFLDKMELIDPAYVEAADDKPKRKKRQRATWGALAACFAIMLLAGTGILQDFWAQGGPQRDPDLPLLTISEEAEGMGYEGYFAYDISELVNANPWNEETVIDTLPVFQNPLTYDKNDVASGGDEGKMRELLLDTAKSLGLNTDQPEVDGSEAPAKLKIASAGLEIEVDQALGAEVRFRPAVSLPETYHFTHYASYAEKAAAAAYLQDRYRDFIGFDDPQLNLAIGDYTIYGQQTYDILFFENGKDTEEKILNYNFDLAAFYCDDNGELFIARKWQADLSKKLGDYPIIRAEEAKELLLNGNYITTVPYEISGAEQVKKVELIYRTGRHEACYMPYYRFYVELPQEARENGLKSYGAYYVPAVESAYISNMPLWDGGFNE